MKQTLATVKAGARVLDKKFPGWAKKIDPTILELDDPNRCILGQLYGDYDKGVIKIGPRGIRSELDSDCINYKGGQWGGSHGFDAETGEGIVMYEQYEQLNCAWMFEIAKRLSPKSR